MLASSLWGCGFFFGKIALAEMNFAHMVLYRFLFAMVPLLPLLLTNRPHLNTKEWGVLLAASFLGVPLQFLLQFYGLSMTTVSHASLMVGTMPVILAVGATIFAHERMDRVGWIAMAASTCGAAMIALGGSRHTEAGGSSLGGDLLIVASLFIALFWILFNKQLMERHSHIVITAYGLALGTGMAFPVIQGAALHATSFRDAGLASGVQATVANLGGSLGLALFVALAAARLGDGSAGGQSPASAHASSTVFLVAGIMLLAGAVLAAIFVRNPATTIQPLPKPLENAGTSVEQANISTEEETTHHGAAGVPIILPTRD